MQGSPKLARIVSAWQLIIVRWGWAFWMAMVSSSGQGRCAWRVQVRFGPRESFRCIWVAPEIGRSRNRAGSVKVWQRDSGSSFSRMSFSRTESSSQKSWLTTLPINPRGSPASSRRISTTKRPQLMSSQSGVKSWWRRFSEMVLGVSNIRSCGFFRPPWYARKVEKDDFRATVSGRWCVFLFCHRFPPVRRQTNTAYRYSI